MKKVKYKYLINIQYINYIYNIIFKKEKFYNVISRFSKKFNRSQSKFKICFGVVSSSSTYLTRKKVYIGLCPARSDSPLQWGSSPGEYAAK